MKKIKSNLSPLLGLVLTIILTIIFIREPSFPTPDKVVIFVFFFCMIFRQAMFVLKRLLPFILILLTYDSFRGIADQLNTNVNYSFPPSIDRWLFGELPTVSLQSWLWHGHVRWYDFALYLPYLLHFVLPIGLAILIWQTKQSYYWRYVVTFTVVSFAAFFTFLLFPAAPPWLASDNGHIEPVTRISSDVWHSLGLTDFPSVYNHISPNPVAAVPSLHAAWAILVSIFVFRYYGRKWGALSALYPLVIFFGTVYQGEHYFIDVVLGVLYAIGAYLISPYIVRLLKKPALHIWSRHTRGRSQAAKAARIRLNHSSNTRSACR
ncbi:MAG: phosphatase PAP2 family protein [Candidatus Saccharimonadales bacterium]